jgi:hypothetical protein
MTNLGDNTGAETLGHQQPFPEKDGEVQLSVQSEIQRAISLDAIEKLMLSEEQIDCPVQHHFGPGIYIREGLIPAGVYILGHAHKKTTMNVLLKGKMAIIVNGQSKIIEGPFIFNSEPGRKFAYAIEDCIFQNIHATDKTNLDEIEEEFIDKSDTWKNKQIENEHFLAIDKAVKSHFERKMS